MHEYIEPSKRKKGSLYLQLGKTRRLIIKIFTKYLRCLPPTGDNEINTLYVKEGSVKTENVRDDNNYRFLCKNLDIMQDEEDPNRVLGNLYFKPDKE